MLCARMACRREWAKQRDWGSDGQQQSVLSPFVRPGLRFRRRHSHRCEAPKFRPDAKGESRGRLAPEHAHGAKDGRSLSPRTAAQIGFLHSGEGMGINGSEVSSSAKWISTRRFDAFAAEPSVSSATRREPARPTQFRRARSMPRATRASATAGASKREGDGATFSPPKLFLTNSVRALVVAAHAIQTAL